MAFKQLLIVTIFPIILIACSNEAKSDSNELKQSFESTNAYFSLDTPIYKVVDTQAKNKISDAIYQSAFMKVAILQAYEKQNIFIGEIEDAVPASLILDYCWIGKFVSDYSKFMPTKNEVKLETLNWLKKKRIKWKSLNLKNYGNNPKITDYCPH